jgi:SpoVK/Ycf46/Vps4 family AAA+-type ATPase
VVVSIHVPLLVLRQRQCLVQSLQHTRPTLCRYLGEGAALLQDIFARARQATPALVIIDDIDAVFSSRQHGSDSSVATQLLAVMLTEMDGLNQADAGALASHTRWCIRAGLAPAAQPVAESCTRRHCCQPRCTLRCCCQPACGADAVVVATSNRPWAVDSALLRPGRFDALIAARLPDAVAREEMLLKYTSDVELAADVRLGDIAQCMHRYTGAEVRAVAHEACLLAASDAAAAEPVVVTHAHLQHASQCFVPSVSEQDVQAFEAWERDNAH